MKILLIVFMVCCAVSANVYQYDNKNVNILGAGIDGLTYELRESIFQLNSVTRSNPLEPVKTSTLPEGVIMRSIPKSNFQMYSNTITHNVNSQSSRTITVSGGGGFMSFSGSFSGEAQTKKSFISNTNHFVTEVKTVIELNEYTLQQSDVNLSEGFSKGVYAVANFIEKNTELSLAYANYIIDDMLNKFGTHYVIGTTNGAVLSMVNSVDISGYTNSIEQSLSASASASFGSYFHIKGSYNEEDTDLEKYFNYVSQSSVITAGGTPWTINSTFDTWVKTIEDNPYTTSYRITYMLDLIQYDNFGDIDIGTLMNVRSAFEDRIKVYYYNNYYLGCADPTSSNYVPYANAFDPNLCDFNVSYHFGGTYTTSTYGPLNVPNILTEEYNCPSGFTPSKLYTQSFQQAITHASRCTLTGFEKWICNILHKDIAPSYVTYRTFESTTYVCLSKEEQTIGMNFGGVYSTTTTNDITESQGCPRAYVAFPIYTDLQKTSAIYICQTPSDSGHVIEVPFGGIFSSQYGNVLVDGSLAMCPKGFERHTLNAHPISAITYCIKLGYLGTGLKKVIPPGYGNTLNRMIDQYVIGSLNDTVKIAIYTNPNDKRSYFEQVSAIVQKLHSHIYDSDVVMESYADIDVVEIIPESLNVIFEWGYTNKVIVKPIINDVVEPTQPKQPKQPENHEEPTDNIQPTEPTNQSTTSATTIESDRVSMSSKKNIGINKIIGIVIGSIVGIAFFVGAGIAIVKYSKNRDEYSQI